MKKKRDIIREKCSSRCYYCNDSFTNWLEFNIDHLIPKVLGGSDDISNLVLSCKKCNSLKANYFLDELKRVLPLVLEKREKEKEHFSFILNLKISDVEHIKKMIAHLAQI